MKENYKVQKALAVFLALVIGAATGGAGIFADTETGAVLLSSVLSVFSSLSISFLFGLGGIIPVFVMSLVMLVTGFNTAGLAYSGYLALVGIVPGAVMVFGSKKGYKFFSQIRNAVIANLVSYVILLAALRFLTGEDFSSFLNKMWTDMLMQMSPEIKNEFAQTIQSILNQGNTVETMMTADEMLNTFIGQMEQTLTVIMPVTIMVYSFMNGAFGTLLMNWLRKKHKEENVQFVPLAGWRLNKQLTLGLIIIYIAVLLIAKTAPDMGVVAETMVITAVFIAAIVQASASILSRLAFMGLTSGKRTLILFAIMFFSIFFMPFYGTLSALFGSKGLFTPKIKVVKTNGVNHYEIEKDDENDKDNNNKEE